MTLILTLAAIAHETNRHYCLSIGDTSQPTWDNAPQWQRDSAILGIEGALAGNTPAQQHQSWMDVKVADGWVYGEVKDPDAKTHPCLVPYEQLPEEQQRKDHLYAAVVKAAHGALTADLNPAPKATEWIIGMDIGKEAAPGTYLTGGVTPTVGRDVHYVSYGTPRGEYKPAHRAAKITDVRPSDQFGFEVRACVMNPEGLFFTGWTHFEPSGHEGGTVHWPERA